MASNFNVLVVQMLRSASHPRHQLQEEEVRPQQPAAHEEEAQVSVTSSFSMKQQPGDSVVFVSSVCLSCITVFYGLRPCLWVVGIGNAPCLEQYVRSRAARAVAM